MIECIMPHCLTCDVSDKPEAPGVPQFSDITDTSIKLTWTPPKDDGGTPITNYNIEYKAADEVKWRKANDTTVTDTSFIVRRLKTGSEYVFRVNAENKVGAGPAATNKESVIIKAPLGMCCITYNNVLYVSRKIQNFFSLLYDKN